MATLKDAGGVQRAFSMHNIPQRPLGQVMLRPAGTMCRASMGLRIQLRGVQSHAAMPQEGNNPMLPLAKLAGVAAELPSWHPAGDGEEPPICTLIHLNCGTRDYGVNPGSHSPVCHRVLLQVGGPNLALFGRRRRDRCDAACVQHRGGGRHGSRDADRGGRNRALPRPSLRGCPNRSGEYQTTLNQVGFTVQGWR